MNILVPLNCIGRDEESITFQTLSAGTEYEGSVFPKKIRDWYALHESLICSAEIPVDWVATFTSLVRTRDLLY